MKLTRRESLGIGLAAGAGVALAGCNRLPGLDARREPAAPGAPNDPVDRVLDRVGFGPTQADRERVRKMGIPAFLDEQLAPKDGFANDEPVLALKLRHLEAFELESAELRDEPDHEVLRQLQQATIVRAVYSRWGLRERMVDFWTNHFNVYARKGLAAYRVPKDQTDVVRAHALGSFPEMLRASAHSTAMLVYLDNQVNVAGVPNENYARELMELHTLGVGGGYTQRDVQEVARCFTGWTHETRLLRPRGQFRFNADLHDDGPKTVLGHAIPAGGGEKDGQRVLDILIGHPSTGKFLAKKLCRYFLGEDGQALEPTVAEAYRKSNGDIPSMLRPILSSKALLEGRGVARRPFDYLAACLRATSADTDGGKAVQDHLERMGQPLHQWPMPDGYPDKTAAWTGSLLARWNFALALCANEIRGTRVPDEVQVLASNLCAPAFQWR